MTSSALFVWVLSSKGELAAFERIELDRADKSITLLVESAQALGIVAALDVCIKRLGVVVEEPSQRRDWTAHGLFAAAAEEGAEESKGD